MPQLLFCLGLVYFLPLQQDLCSSVYSQQAFVKCGLVERWRGSSLTPFQAFTTGLASRVGVGNIGGVATAIALGGEGAVFWMWVTAFIGMSSAFAESTLAPII